MKLEKCYACKQEFNSDSLCGCEGGCLAFFCEEHLKDWSNEYGIVSRLCPGCYELRANK